MTYDEFKKEVVDTVSDSFDMNYEVYIKSITKNNGLVYDGLVIKTVDINIAPTIYINNYYARFENGMPFEEIVEEIIECYEKSKFQESLEIDFFTNFEKVKNNIVIKLINRDKNQELLKDVPYIEFLDLAIVFCYMFDGAGFDDSQATILVMRNHINLWKVEINDLLEIAKENTKRILGISVASLFDTVNELVGFNFTGCPTDLMPVYVLTNNLKTNGATSIVFLEVLDELANDLNSDLYIIPSSVHETLVMAANDHVISVDGLRDTIRYVNNHEVNEVDVLSDNLYMYSKDKKRLYLK